MHATIKSCISINREQSDFNAIGALDRVKICPQSYFHYT